MKLYFPFIMSCFLLFTSCVKEEGKTLSADSTTDSGGSTTGGSAPSAPVEDPLAREAWHLKNTGQSTFSNGNGTLNEDISLEQAIDEGFTGKGVKIAVSDSGTDVGHEDLSKNQLTGQHRNYAFSDPSLWRGALPYVQGNDAHGTAVAGLVAAAGWNGLGARGVAPEAKFAGFSYVINYSSAETPDSMVARSVDQTDGDFDIFNYSYGYGQCYFVEEDPLVLEAVETGVETLRSSKGAVYVQAAGNDFTGYLSYCLGVTIPGTFAGNTNFSDDMAQPEKIIVGAVNALGTKSSYSTPGSGIWVSAPGGEDGEDEPAMLTTDISGCSKGYSRVLYGLDDFNRGALKNSKCNYTSLMNGTSSATPVTSGVIALMLEANPALSWRDVKHILALTSDKPDFALLGFETNSTGMFEVGQELFHPLGLDLTYHKYDWLWVKNAAGLEFSNWYGFGRVNALNAVLMANTYSFPLGAYEKTSNPQTNEWYYDSGDLAQAIPDENETGIESELEVSHNFFVESVQVQVTIEHDKPSDLGISLISPRGTESRLIHINSNVYALDMPANKLLMSNAFYGEESLGTWKLKVIDGLITESGTLTNWKIRINGHRISGDGSFPDPVTSATIGGVSYPSGSVTPQVSFNPSASVDVIRYELSVGTAPGLSNKAAWTSVGLNHINPQLSGLRLTNNTNYYLNIRAIDSRENASGVVTVPWRVSW